MAKVCDCFPELKEITEAREPAIARIRKKRHRRDRKVLSK